ncbi:unnamed protein product [Caenorhabditis auriculariae]|uniref:Uncharacterized protein n=1 Tax=Caenorhabditis auriculariae TaxID=2777116 RepID=A0A8S1GYV7_9PELO|nr:unnamed protein product [Caenorhabditis auriculariae]
MPRRREFIDAHWFYSSDEDSESTESADGNFEPPHEPESTEDYRGPSNSSDGGDEVNNCEEELSISDNEDAFFAAAYSTEKRVTQSVELVTVRFGHSSPKVGKRHTSGKLTAKLPANMAASSPKSGSSAAADESDEEVPETPPHDGDSQGDDVVVDVEE